MHGPRRLWLLAILAGLAGTAVAQEPSDGAQETPPATTDATDASGAEGNGSSSEASSESTSSSSSGALPGTTDDYDVDRAQGQLNRELRTVEQDVNGLKERVFRSKATLQLLRELVLEGANSGSRVVVWHENRMGPAYTLESVQYFLDGKNIYSRIDQNGGLDAEREIQLLEAAIPPGAHNLQVSIVLRGNGMGLFPYLKAYSFRVQSSYSFNVEEGRATTLRVVANERGGPWRTFVDRPNIEYEEESEKAIEPE